MAGGVLVVVPDSLSVLTTYVLREQLDWFEDEIKFVRRLLQPGERVVDIGANYGVYALTMARLVGPSGTVLAFEPADATAALLAESIRANAFGNVVLERCAVSAAGGTARLRIADQSEYNALVHGELPATETETVQVVSLDDYLARHRCTDVAFVKLDAEGEESQVIAGARRFLTECSPLILFEIRSDGLLHLNLVDEFARLGYESYRLVPGLDLLVPFDAYAEPDTFQLNLFCCKPDRAAALAARGLLVDSTAIDDYAEANSLATFYRTHRDDYAWTTRLTRMPYGRSLGDCGSKERTREFVELEDALAYYAISQDANLASITRFSALQASLNLLYSLCSDYRNHLRLMSLVRVAADFGARSAANDALQMILKLRGGGASAVPYEPFLAPVKRFEDIPIGADLSNWTVAACSERFEQLSALSSFFSVAPVALARLNLIVSLGFGGEEMARRLSLVRARGEGPGAAAAVSS
jgi:FkbM family methyltransferase